MSAVGFFNGILNSPQNNDPEYVVGQDPALYQYTSVQDAIDDAVADGASTSNWKTVRVMTAGAPYVGTLNIASGVNVIGNALNGNQLAARIVATPGNPAINLPSEGACGIQSLNIVGETGQPVISNPTPTDDLFLFVYNSFVEGTSAAQGLVLDNGGSGHIIRFEAYNSIFQAPIACNLGEGVEAELRSATRILGTTNSFVLNNADNLLAQNCQTSGPVQVTGGTSNCFFVFGSLSSTSGVPLQIIGSSTALTAMVQIEAAAGDPCVQIGAGSTLQSFFCPFAATGGAANVIAENGPGDAGTFVRGSCFAAGTVSTIQGTITAVGATAI